MDPTRTTLSEEYLSVLDELNRIAMDSGDALEGNMLYLHQEPHPGRDNIAPRYHLKRCNYAVVCKNSTRMLEVGFNGGHSALLALAEGIEYHGVDICQYAYTRRAADFLKQVFGERFHFYEGNSLQLLPALAKSHAAAFDLVHIDGNHVENYCRSDAIHGLKLGAKNGWFLLDDADMKTIRLIYDEHVRKGDIFIAQPDGWIDHNPQAIGRIA